MSVNEINGYVNVKDNSALKENTVSDQRPPEMVHSETIQEVDTSSQKVSNKELNGIIENDSDNENKSLSNSKILECSSCGKEFKDFCTKCSMLLCILHNSVEDTSNDRTRETLPSNILEIRTKYSHFAVYAKRTIPKNIIFGPFDGLIYFENNSTGAWKMKGGTLVASKTANWMQCINCVDEVSFQNIVIFQYENNLYCRTSKEINADDELLVFYGDEYIKYINSDVETYYRPIIEKELKNPFACTYCCLGFVSEVYLAQHKTHCPHETKENQCEEVIQCPTCKIHLYEKEYLESHKKCCSVKPLWKETPTPRQNIDHVGTSYLRKLSTDSYDEYTAPPTSKYAKMDSDEDYVKEEYQCYHCNQIFNFKTSLIRHIQKEHSKLKQYKCIPCSFATKSEKSLELHFTSVRHVKRTGSSLPTAPPQVKDYQTSFEAFLQNRN